MTREYLGFVDVDLRRGEHVGDYGHAVVDLGGEGCVAVVVA